MLNSTPPFLVKVIFFLTKPVLLNTRPLFQPSSFIKLLFFSIEPKYNSSLCLPLFVEGFSFKQSLLFNQHVFFWYKFYLLNQLLVALYKLFISNQTLPFKSRDQCWEYWVLPTVFCLSSNYQIQIGGKPGKKTKKQSCEQNPGKVHSFFCGEGVLGLSQVFPRPKNPNVEKLEENQQKTQKQQSCGKAERQISVVLPVTQSFPSILETV